MNDSKKKKIKITENGPCEVRGNVPLRRAVMEADEKGASGEWKDGKAYEAQEHYYLCRCGHPQKSPTVTIPI